MAVSISEGMAIRYVPVAMSWGEKGKRGVPEYFDEKLSTKVDKPGELSTVLTFLRLFPAGFTWSCCVRGEHDSL
jgi:hypothetical protein